LLFFSFFSNLFLQEPKGKLLGLAESQQLKCSQKVQREGKTERKRAGKEKDGAGCSETKVRR